MATEEVAGMKVSTILIVVIVLWFLSSQISKTTAAINNASSSADKLTGPIGGIGNALSGLINAGANAIGRFVKGSGGGTSTSSGSSAAWDPDGQAVPDFDKWGSTPSSWSPDSPARDGTLYA